jgi:hypothetical protein
LVRALAALMALAWLTVGQPLLAASGVIAGLVLRPDGQSAGEARVTLVSAGFHRQIAAGASGEFSATGLEPGAFAVFAESGGAYAEQTALVKDGETVRLTLILGSARAPGSELPLIGRDALDLARLPSEITHGQQGGDIEGNGPFGVRGNAALNAYGQRSQNNGFLLDGVDNNQPWAGGIALPPPLEGVSTVRVLSGYIPARYGHTSGAAVLMETRSGGDGFHGSAFDYWRNSALDARNFFDRARPGSLGNRFGASLGGALRSKWYLFGDGELLRGREGQTVVSTVPTLAEQNGFFNTVIYDPLSITEIAPNIFTKTPYPNNAIPQQAVWKRGAAVAALYPLPNVPGAAANNYAFATRQIRNSSRADARLDRPVSLNSSVFLRVTYGTGDGRMPGALPRMPSMPDGSFAGSAPSQNAFGIDTRETWQGAAAAYTTALRPALVNELRAGFSVDDLHATAADAGVNASALTLIPGLGMDGLPNVKAPGYASLGASSAAPFALRAASFQVSDSVAWKTGRHAFRFGFEAIRRHMDGDASDWTSRGSFIFSPDFTSQPGLANTGNSFASLLLGYPTEVRRDVQFAPYRLRATEWAGYAQDSFRLGPRLTVEIGLRYSLSQPVSEANSRMVNFNSSKVVPALDQFAGANGVDRYGNVGYNKRALAPRVGLAWDALGTGAAVLRASFSQVWDPGSLNSLGYLARNPPYASRLDTYYGTYYVGRSVASGLPAPVSASLTNGALLNAANGAIYTVEPSANYTPYADQWSLSLAVRPHARWTAELTGMGSMGMHLLAAYDANQPYPAPTYYTDPRWPYEPYHGRVEHMSFGGGSTYYGGVAKITGEAWPRLHLQASYTYAKSLDDATAPGSDQGSRPSSPQYIYNPHGIRSPSPFDIAERLVVAARYDLPARPRAGALSPVLAGWSVYALVTAESGLPFTPELATNNLSNGGFQLPHRRGDGALPASQRSYLHWFNTNITPGDPSAAFQMPDLYKFGDSGFNILRGPGLATLDAALTRSVRLKERAKLVIRGEAYNLLNRVNFALPNRILGLANSGAIDHTATTARRMQMAVRVEW